MYGPALASIVLEKQTDVLSQGASWTCQLHFHLCTFQSARDDAGKGLLQHLSVEYPTRTLNIGRRQNTYFLTFLDLDSQWSLDCTALICWLYQ
jgi:hypothetical protein